LVSGRSQDLDVVEHLDPIGRIPARNHEPQWKAIQQRKLLAVHRIGDHHLAIARMVDVERLHQPRRIRHDRLVEAAETHLHRAGLHTRAIEHVFEAHASPQRVAHRAVRPLRAGYSGHEESARVAGTLVDGCQFHARQSMEQVVERQRQGPLHMAMHGEAKSGDIDRGRDPGPMPAHVELVVGREHAFVKDFPGRLEEGRSGPLQNHRPLLGKLGRDWSRIGISGQ
jgi:hypothetical protein